LGSGGIELKPSPALALLDPSYAQHEFKLVATEAASSNARLPTQYEYFAQFTGPSDGDGSGHWPVAGRPPHGSKETPAHIGRTRPR